MVTTRAQQKADERPKRTPKAAVPAPVSTAQRPVPKRRKATSNASAKAKANAAASRNKPTPKKKGQHTSRAPRKTSNKTKAVQPAPAATDGTILEKGILYFFVRPKVDIGDDPHGTEDIQRSFLVFRPLPDGKDDLKTASTSSKCRILVVPKKTMPNAKKHDRFLSFVKSPSIDVQEVSEEFKSFTYMTKTKGERTQPAAVPIAEAVYALVEAHGGGTTHLTYVLTVPEENKIDEVQKELGVVPQASFVAQVRNPKFPAPPSAGISGPASFSEEIMQQFENKRWGPLRPEHLTYEHAEVLLIGAHDDLAHEADGAEEELIGLKRDEEKRVQRLGADDVVFEDLRLRREEFRKELDFSGTWKQ